MRYVIPLFFLFVFHSTVAQESSYQYLENIKQLKKDRLGYVYLVGNKSVCKFDGKDTSSSCLYLDEQINDIAVISENKYAVGIDDKLVVYKHQIIEDEITLEEVITNLEFFQNYILIGTLGSGLYRYSIAEKKLESLLRDGFINDITTTKKNSYVITDEDVFKFGKNVNLVQKKKLSELSSKQILEYDDDKLAILMNDGKVIFMNSSLEVQHIYEDTSFKPKEITGNDGLLFAIDDQHLKQWMSLAFIELKKGNFEHISHEQTLLFTSHKKNLTSQNSLSSSYEIDKTFSVFEHDNQFWLGREGKVSIFENGKIIKDISFPEPYKNMYVSSLVVDQNKVYVGSMGMGILVFDASTGVLIDTFQQQDTKLNEQNVIKLKIKDDLLWVGYLNGLKAFDLERKELKYDFNKLLKGNYLYDFHIKNFDDFYLGTSNDGLIHVVKGEPNYFLKGFSIYSIVETPMGIIFSAENEGLFIIQDTVLKKLSDQYFFRTNDVYNMLYSNNNVLFANEFGIDILNLEKNKISYLSHKNLNEPQLNANASNASKTLLGYDNGIIEINNSLLDEVHIHGLSIKTPLLFNAQIEEGKTEFTHKQNAWTFEYDSKNFYASNEKYYKYRLIPIEQEWINTTLEKITYYNLPPGDYRFELSSGGHRNFTPLQTENFEFSISKPFWMKPFFWLLSLLIIVVFIYFVIKNREKQIKKKEKLKTFQLQYEYQRLKDQINPHFLFNSFNSLIGIVENNPKQATQVLEKLSSLFRNILKHEKTEIISLAEELELIMQYFEIHKIRFQNLIQLNISTIPDSHKKFVIPFSLQLLVENAIKHNVINSRSKLEISIYLENDFLVVVNTLNQKHKNAASLGLGLDNLIKRNEMILNKKPIITKEENFFTVKIPYIHE